MEKKILFVGNNNSFVTKAIHDELTSSGYECSDCSATVYAIERGVKDVDALFVYIDEDILERPDALVYIRDTCVGDQIKVFLMGYPDELGRILGDFDDDILGGVFERPINTKDVIEEVNKQMEKDSQAGRKKHILIVDDNGTMLRTMKNSLEPEFRVSLVNSAINAMTFLGTNKVDLILLDYDMPVCSGAQMLEMLRSETTTETIPVIFLTGKNDRASIESVIKLKPQGYLLKSMATTAVVDYVRDFFEKQRIEKINARK